ncbi:MAG: sel1 repeat family protein [Pedosphaera sp.]|nr:sel1 repeat family protein [Pedosphaera sp.]
MEATSRPIAGKGFYLFALVLVLSLQACSSKKSETSEIVPESQPVAAEPAPISEPVKKISKTKTVSQLAQADAATNSSNSVPVTTPPQQARDSSAESFKHRLEKITGKSYPTNKEVQDKAEQGDLESQFALARKNINEGNFEEAVKWYRKAADQNDPEAQNDLGALHVFGQGVPQDFAEATRLFRLAADQGYAQAQYSLGLRYALGQSVEQDYAEAAKWFGLAAQQGVADAQLSLGRRYAHGEGVTQDYAEAYAWYKISLPEKPDAQALMDELGPKLTPKQMEIALQRANAFVPKKTVK